MTQIDIISGFLGAGKTTLIKKLLTGAYPNEKLVLIENEFGEINIDGGFLQEAGIQISEMSSGCICCSLVGDFGQALLDVQEQFHPDRILIEPSGVGKLSDVISAVEQMAKQSGTMELSHAVTVVDAGKCKVYMKNFGEFFNNQIENAQSILLSRTGKLSQEKVEATVALLREHNQTAAILTTPWEQLEPQQIRAAMEHTALLELHDCDCHEHHHDHDCGCHEHEHHHDHDCGCHEHEHHHDHDCGCHEHEHHHDHDCGCHEHEHHHDHDCGCHEHEHHHDHDCGCHEHHHHHDCDCGCHDHAAAEVFSSWGAETPRRYTQEELERILTALDSGAYGHILRAKGILPAVDGTWLHFDFVPEERSIRTGAADYTGRLCVIGAGLVEDELRHLFEV